MNHDEQGDIGLVREAREYARIAPPGKSYDIITRLADALERARTSVTEQSADALRWTNRALVAESALAALKPGGPRTPDDSMVICPNCTHQFPAISVDDQAALRASEDRAGRLEAAEIVASARSGGLLTELGMVRKALALAEDVLAVNFGHVAPWCLSNGGTIMPNVAITKIRCALGNREPTAFEDFIEELSIPDAALSAVPPQEKP